MFQIARRTVRKKESARRGIRLDIFKSFEGSAGAKARAATTKIRAARHFLRDVEPWNY